MAIAASDKSVNLSDDTKLLVLVGLITAGDLANGQDFLFDDDYLADVWDRAWRMLRWGTVLDDREV